MSRRAILACSTAILRSQQLKFVVFNHLHEPLVCSVSSSCGVFNEVYSHSSVHGALHKRGNVILEEHSWIHSTCRRNMTQEAMKPVNIPESGGASSDIWNDKVKRKKLKGKRAVRRWLRFFRWKKKKDYERMTAEEKILYKLRKARNKETRLLEAMKKIEPKETSETTHDPEILTPEEHFYFLKMGLKCKNYVPVGRRGIYQGVILNMHLHWKKHQTLQVIVKTFTPDEVNEIAVELARLSGGIVLDIHEENTIIMYKGKNYSQPPTEIMSPRVTLPRIKALNKSKYRDGLRAVRKFIPRLEQDLDLLQAQVKSKHEAKMEVINGSQETEISSDREAAANQRQESSDRLQKLLAANNELYEQNSATESGMTSESEGLSDIFETDSDEEVKDGKRTEHSLYLDELEKFPTESNGEAEDFEEHLRQISSDPKTKNDEELPDLDEVDRIVLRAGSLLRKKRGDRR